MIRVGMPASRPGVLGDADFWTKMGNGVKCVSSFGANCADAEEDAHSDDEMAVPVPPFVDVATQNDVTQGAPVEPCPPGQQRQYAYDPSSPCVLVAKTGGPPCPAGQEHIFADDASSACVPKVTTVPQAASPDDGLATAGGAPYGAPTGEPFAPPGGSGAGGAADDGPGAAAIVIGVGVVAAAGYAVYAARGRR